MIAEQVKVLQMILLRNINFMTFSLTFATYNTCINASIPTRFPSDFSGLSFSIHFFQISSTTRGEDCIQAFPRER